MESMQLIEPGTEPPAEFGESDPESDDEGLTNPYDSDLVSLPNLFMTSDLTGPIQGYETGSSSYAADLTADTLTISRGFGGVRAAGANASRENVKPAGPNTMLLVEAFSNMDSDSVMDSQSISATISQTNIESQDGGIALDPGPPEAVEAESPEREKTISTGFSYTDRAMVHSGRAATVKDRGKWVKIKVCNVVAHTVCTAEVKTRCSVLAVEYLECMGTAFIPSRRRRPRKGSPVGWSRAPSRRMMTTTMIT